MYGLKQHEPLASPLRLRLRIHRAVVENWMDFVAEVVEPLADVLPEQIVKKNGRPWEL